MESEEKKNKRPRIGQMRASSGIGDMQDRRPAASYSGGSYTSDGLRPAESSSDNADSQGGYRQPYQRQQRPYQSRQQGAYNNNHYGNHDDNQPSFQRRPYHPSTPAPDGNTDGDEGYTPRQQPHYNQGGYGNRQGNYNNGNRQGGYNGGGNRQGGYNNNRQGGYNNVNRQGGYNGGGNNRQGGYNNNRQGGYNNGNNRQGGYNGGANNRQGGYNNNNNRQGGYNNNGNRQGGYNNNNNRQGGYNNNGNRRQQPRQNQYGMPQGGKSFTPRPKRIEYEMPIPDPNEQIRLNKFMANAGICSRREADEFIQQGLVKVNGNVVTELGTKISHDDTVEFNDKVVTLERKCYILLNKPKDCVTTSDDPNDRLTVMDLVKGACEERIYPVGRLDRNTTGVLLLTNDGDLASKLTHPKYVKKKIYHVWCDKDISEDDMQRIADGIELEDGEIHADAISYATETDRNQAGIEIHSGRNRIVRRIFESLGYHVTKLDRVYFAGLTKKNLPRGRWRYLTQEEVNFLKMGSFE
ncbi:MAG: RNA-binding S4 domain-containing protein [Clostridium sp.]|nr:RNA-binding S4 domain-containing protein [Clostridium sp.]